MKNAVEIPEPWKSFFKEIDESLDEQIRLEILGGFGITILYGSPRTTADVDIVSIIPNTTTKTLIKTAGEGSPLHKNTAFILIASESQHCRKITKIEQARFLQAVFKTSNYSFSIRMTSRWQRSSEILTATARM